MATDFDDDERSTSASRPIDLYTIATPSTTYRLTSYIKDVSYGGFLYTATTMSRGTHQIAQDLTGRELIVYLPISHPIVQRFASAGVPEREVTVTLHRLQQRSGQAIQQWTGFAQSLAIDGRTAQVRVPSLTDDAMRVRLPVVYAQRLCNHVLYDAQCRINRNLFAVPTVVVTISGQTLVVQNSGSGTFAEFGEVVNDVTGERRHIIHQDGGTLTIDVPFADLANGGAVTVFAGCDHSLNMCKTKYGNVPNFGGMPHMNGSFDFWAPNGVGIVVQT